MPTPEQKKARKRARRLRWRELHPEQWREEKRRYNQRRYARQRAALGKTVTPYKDHCKGTLNLSRPRLKQYGITQEDLDELFRKQSGRCGICDAQLKPHWTEGYKHKANVDHCHRTNVVRGILCYKCNVGIGMFGDDVWRLQRAIEYLKKHFSPT